jgi:ketosteroid isomerase-like protein
VSGENVEIVRGLYEAFARRDNESPFELFADDIEWDTTPYEGAEFAGTGIGQLYRGHDGVRLFWRRWLEAWSEIDFDFEVIDLGGDRVAGIVTRQRNRGHGSGIWVDQQPYAQLWTLREGKVVRMKFVSVAEARDLAGDSETGAD